MEEKEYNKLFSLMVKKFDLHKKQTSTDVFIKRGEIAALNKIKLVIESQIKTDYLEIKRKLEDYIDDETSMIDFDINSKEITEKELYNTYQYIINSINKEKIKLTELSSLEKVFDILDKNLEDSLKDLDLLGKIEKNKTNIPKDIEARIKTNKCSFKRPGRVKFPCNEELVPGEKYCKEHLKQFNPEIYFDKGL